MSVRFIGNTDWEPTEDAIWGNDSWGLDTCEVIYRGSRLKMAAFIENLDRWSGLESFGRLIPRNNNMRLASWSKVSFTPSFPGISLRYIGLKDGNLPPVKGEDDTCIMQANGEGIDTATHLTVTGTFTYQASRTTYTWIETREPRREAPRYSGVRQPLNPLSRIKAYSISEKDTGKRVNSIRTSQFVAVFNSLVVGYSIEDFHVEDLIPGKLWGCRTETVYKIIN